MAERKTGPEMLGEFCRDAGVLVAVFAPLEAIVRGGTAALTQSAIFVIVGVSGGLLIAGVALERFRK